MFPNFWTTYDPGYPSLDCFEDVLPDLDLPKPEFDSFVDSPVNGFSNSVDFVSEDLNAYSWVQDDSPPTNAPLPPISSFFENTRTVEEDCSPLSPNDVFLELPEVVSPSLLPVPMPMLQTSVLQSSTCTICEKVLPSIKSLKHHICMIHQIIDKTCTFEFCTYVSKTRKEYNTHVRQHNLLSIHEKKRSRLTKIQVNYSIRNQKELEGYMKTCSKDIIDTIHEQKRDLLVQRTNIANMNLDVEYNIREKKWVYKYICVGCLKEFARDYNAKRHSEKHSTRNVVCPFCDRMVRGTMALKTHVTKYHQITD